MYAAVAATRIHVHALDAPDRDAEILEVEHTDGSPPYVLRWSDTGHEALVFPAPDATVQQFERLPVGPDQGPRTSAALPKAGTSWS